MLGQLQEQLHLLQGYCVQFDSGDWLAAKPMSTSLRVLLHHLNQNRDKGHCLLSLGLEMHVDGDIDESYDAFTRAHGSKGAEPRHGVVCHR